MRKFLIPLAAAASTLALATPASATFYPQPTISSMPAVVAAIRAATGLELPRAPVRPQDIALA